MSEFPIAQLKYVPISDRTVDELQEAFDRIPKKIFEALCARTKVRAEDAEWNILNCPTLPAATPGDVYRFHWTDEGKPVLSIIPPKLYYNDGL